MASSREAPRRVDLRTDEVVLTAHRMRALSLFGDLPPRMEGRLRGLGGQGAVVLRRFRAGEIVCREGDPGYTAFLLLRTDDLIELRKIHRSLADSADKKLSARAPDKLALQRRERRKLAEELERTSGDTALADLLFASAGRPEEGEIDALTRELGEQEAGDRADAELASSHPALADLDPPAKRRRADESANDDPRLASLLRASAQAAELRVRAVVTVARPAPPDRAAPPGLLRRLLGGGSPSPSRAPGRTSAPGDPPAG
jgi:hypothetical protein